LANFVKAIELGIFNEETQKRMQELQPQKEDLNAAIGAENVKQARFEGENSIKAYFASSSMQISTIQRCGIQPLSTSSIKSICMRTSSW